jgi:MEMO1 family protein
MNTDRPRLRPLEAVPQEVDGRQMIILRDPEGISDKVAALPPALAGFLFTHVNGTKSMAELDEQIGGDLGPILAQLDDAYFLDSPRFQAKKNELLAAYRAAPCRPARSAGVSYPADEAELRTFLDGLYEDLPTPTPPGPLKAVAIPHLDLRFGGKVAAKGLTGLAQAFTGDTVIVLGVGHALGSAPYALTRQTFETPLGRTPTDTDLVDRIVRKTGDWVLDGEFTHRDEHSVEFAVLLLQHALSGRDFKVLPVLCGSFHHLHLAEKDPREDALVDVFIETLEEEAGDALIVASVDLAHMGPFYGDEAPLTPELLRAIGVADVEMLAAMEHRDEAAFFAHLSKTKNGRRVCGSSALYTTLALLPEGPDGRLVGYEQPAFPEEGNTVTICSMAFESSVS